MLRLELERQHIGLLMVYPSFLDTPIERNALGGDGQPASHARSTVGQVRGACFPTEAAPWPACSGASPPTSICA